ncbi:MAG: hypothetical protein H0U75_04025 [Legionella sp.]|nr:hypothetical protein [Legionella sp.]
MKLKSILFILFCSLFTTAFAETAEYSKATNPDPIIKSITSKNGCGAIRVINNTAGAYDILVSTSVDNYYQSWVIWTNHFLDISTFYDGYCHTGINNLKIESYFSPTYNTGWVSMGSVITVNYLSNKLQATIAPK